jgi:hypothetical protein
LLACYYFLSLIQGHIYIVHLNKWFTNFSKYFNRKKILKNSWVSLFSYPKGHKNKCKLYPVGEENMKEKQNWVTRKQHRTYTYIYIYRTIYIEHIYIYIYRTIYIEHIYSSINIYLETFVLWLHIFTYYFIFLILP